MKLFCEHTVETFLPAVRALLSKELMDKYRLTQEQVANKLGVTQAAISQYRKELRGYGTKRLEKEKDIIKKLSNVADVLHYNEIKNVYTTIDPSGKLNIITNSSKGLKIVFELSVNQDKLTAKYIENTFHNKSDLIKLAKKGTIINVKESLLPTIRALIAKELIDRYDLTQEQAAQKMGITQAAVSQYKRDMRGYKAKELTKQKDIMEEIAHISDNVMENKVSDHMICKVCEKIRNKKLINSKDIVLEKSTVCVC